MNEIYSNRISGVKASAIREILKLMSDPEMISFGGGNPASESFPVKQIADISNHLLIENPYTVLQYGITEGNMNLKKEVLSYVNLDNKVTADNDDILITSGSQQIMDFVAKVFCNEGDYVICEEPSFLGALNAFKSNGAELIGIPMEEDGMNIALLEESLQGNPKPKFIYTIPNYQNPTGITTSEEKRKKIYELAKKYQVFVLEDNPYGALRFNGTPILPIKSFDEEGLVIYAVSLSKVIAPGMRVAAMIANKEIIQKCTIAKQVNDVHTNAWAQSVMAEFLKQTDMKMHLNNLQKLYKEKCELMLENIKSNFSDKVSYTIPEGGMFIWVTLPNSVDMMEFVKSAMELKVAVVPGNAFYVDAEKKCHSFRMNFSTPSKEDIIDGCKVLGDLTYKYCK